MRHPSFSTRLAVVPMLVIAVAACEKLNVAKRSDSLQVALSEQTNLGNQLQVQKDSLTRIVLDADAFLGQVDSALRTVRGLPKAKHAATEGALAEQVAARKDMMTRVSALVARAKTTASQLSELQAKQADLQSQNDELREAAQAQAAKTASDAQMVADLGATIERQRLQIAEMGARIDSLGRELGVLGTKAYTAFYVVGTEDELIKKGIVVKEGGANLLFARPGQTLQPARVLNAAEFTAIDQRQTTVIPMPDSTSRYRVISRQDLNDADVVGRQGTQFKGNLNITRPDHFWAPSKFLILVKG